MSALWFSVGEAYFICRFLVHFSYTFVFSQKLLFWSFFNFFIFFQKFPMNSTFFFLFFSFFLTLFGFPHIFRKCCHVQRRSIYLWKALDKAGDIGWFYFKYVPFSRVKCVENGTENSVCSVFHVFNDGKWNGLEIKPAYATRLFNSFPGIYRPQL